MIIKYKVERTFKDKYSKEIVKENDIIDVTIERMKELNEKKLGRVVDIILEAEEQEKVISADKNENTENEKTNDEQTDETKKEETGKEKYTKEQLEDLTVNQLKDLAEEIKCELTKAKKDEMIQEILEFQAK